MRTSENTKVRLDRWLCAARFFKTRQMAAAAIKRGNIRVNGQRAKAAKLLIIGDQLSIRKNQLDYEVQVLTLAEKRAGAKIAATYYQESTASVAAREVRSLQLASNKETLIDGKPSKKDRRTRQAIKRDSGF